MLGSRFAIYFGAGLHVAYRRGGWEFRAGPDFLHLSNSALHRRIANRKSLRFSQLIDEGSATPVVVVTFLAVLELFKRSMVDLTQDEEFGDIRIDYIEGSGELVLDLRARLSRSEHRKDLGFPRRERMIGRRRLCRADGRRSVREVRLGR